MASNNQFVTFNNGRNYPILGFGTWKVITNYTIELKSNIFFNVKLKIRNYFKITL